MIQTCELAQRAGATVIVVTERASQLAKLADIALAVDVDEDPDVYSPMVGRLAQLTLVDALAVAVALKRGPSCRRHCARQRKRSSPNARRRRNADATHAGGTQPLDLIGSAAIARRIPRIFPGRQPLHFGQ
jgi:RpiR family carbohydrate utilization transcriptional regulator